MGHTVLPPATPPISLKELAFWPVTAVNSFRTGTLVIFIVFFFLPESELACFVTVYKCESVTEKEPVWTGARFKAWHSIRISSSKPHTNGNWAVWLGARAGLQKQSRALYLVFLSYSWPLKWGCCGLARAEMTVYEQYVWYYVEIKPFSIVPSQGMLNRFIFIGTESGSRCYWMC